MSFNHSKEAKPCQVKKQMARGETGVEGSEPSVVAKKTVIPASVRLKWENQAFKACLSFTETVSHKQTNKRMNERTNTYIREEAAGEERQRESAAGDRDE